VYGFSRAELGWARADTIGFLAAGAVLMVGFVLWEARASNPLLPLRVVFDRVRGGAFIVSVLIGAALLGGLLFLTFHFQIVLGMSPLVSGLASLPMALTIMVTAAFVAKLLPVVGPRLLMTFGPVIAAGGLLWFSRITADGAYAVQVLPGQILLGIGLAMVFVPMQNLALAGIDARDAGVAGAALTATQQVGGSIGIAVFTALYTSAVSSFEMTESTNPLSALVDGYSTVFVAAAIGLLVGAVVAWFMIRVSKETFSIDPEAVHLG
jgi:hypothetical protein